MVETREPLLAGQDDFPLPPTPSKTIGLKDLRDGWRGGAFLGAITAGSVLLLNIGITIWAQLRQKSNGGHIYHGNCGVTERVNMAVHIVINIFSTLLLGASNYCMQCICAPTRTEIDAAHRQGNWLDIGVQSLRNLSSVSSRKRWLWIILALSSVPLHLLYNSMFYSSTVAREYEVYVVSDSWLQGAPDNGGGEAEIKMQEVFRQNPSRFERMNTTACIDEYAKEYLSQRSNLLLISDRYEDHTFNSSSGTFVRVAGSVGDVSILYSVENRYAWMCNLPIGIWGHDYTSSVVSDRYSTKTVEAKCKIADVKKNATLGQWTLHGYRVTGCLSEKAEETCSVGFNLAIGIVVIVMNFGKALCIILILFQRTDPPMITVGDAIASFLPEPDRLTGGRCLMTVEQFRKELRNPGKARVSVKPQLYEPRTCRRWKMTGIMSWFTFLSFFVLSFGTVLGLVLFAIKNLQTYDHGSFSSLVSLGFGRVSLLNLIHGQGWAVPPTGSAGLLSAIIVANIPQLLLSGLYLTLNNIMTRIYLQVEWTGFSKHRKALRVSRKRIGVQRATYFLHLPYRASLPLMGISATLHWLVSQSIFLAVVDIYDSSGRPGLRGDGSPVVRFLTTCGYSPLAMISTLIVGTLIILVPVIVGARPIKGNGMPLVGSCSAAIAAACHAPKDGKDVEKPVMWGAISEGLLEEIVREQNEPDSDHIGHCSFSSGPVDIPVPGRLYE